MAAEYEMSLADYFSVIKRRIIPISIGFISFLIISILVIVALPSVFQSKGTILIESPQISKDLVQGAAATYADERIEVIKQRVLTRENLFKIIEKHKLYTKERKSLTSSEVIDNMRKNISINLVSAETGKRNNKVTIAFDLVYESNRADIAYKVTNELVTLFLDENVKARTESATETTAFLAEQAEVLRKQLEDIEDKVASFKQKNSSSLPEYQQLYMSSLERMDSQLKEIEKEQRSTQDEIQFLNVELMGAKAGLVDKQSFKEPIVNSVTELDKLRAQYNQLQGVYKEQHPSMVMLKSKITALEATQANAPVQPTANTPSEASKREFQASDLIVAKLQAQIEAAKGRLELLAKQKTALLAKISKQEQDMTLSPIVNRELLSLERDYENAKVKYEEVRSKQLNAKISQNLEEDNKAERFSLVEPPVLADKPIKPDRPKLVVAAFPLSLILPIILAIMFEMVNPRVRGVDAVTAMMRQAPLVVIPLIMNEYEFKKRKKTYITLVLIAVIFILIALAAVHIVFMPIDVLAAKIIAKL